MPKVLLHIACSLLILLNGMSYSIIQAHFFIQQDQIVVIFCINQDKPEMKCEGKCELGKRLSEAKNQQKNGEEITLEELSLIYTLEGSWEFDLKPIKPTLTIPLIYNHNFRISGIDWDFFHPPRA